MIRFLCPTCKSVLQSPGQTAGDKVACPKCGQRVLVPNPVKPAAANKTVLGTALPESNSPVAANSTVPDSRPLSPPQPLPSLPPPTAAAVPAPQNTALSSAKPSGDVGPEWLGALRKKWGISGSDQKHSGLGIASFLIALMVGGLHIVLAVIVAISILHSSRREGLQAAGDTFVGGGVSLVCLNCASLPVCLVGVGLAVVALVAHKDCNHLFTWIGLLGNGVVVLGVIAFYLLAGLKGG